MTMANKKEVHPCICSACDAITEIPDHIYWSMYEFYKCPYCQQNVNINQASFLWIAKYKLLPALERESQTADIARLCGASSNDGREIALDSNKIAPQRLYIPVMIKMSPVIQTTEDSEVMPQMERESYCLEKILNIDKKRVAIYRIEDQNEKENIE